MAHVRPAALTMHRIDILVLLSRKEGRAGDQRSNISFRLLCRNLKVNLFYRTGNKGARQARCYPGPRTDMERVTATQKKFLPFFSPTFAFIEPELAPQIITKDGPRGASAPNAYFYKNLRNDAPGINQID